MLSPYPGKNLSTHPSPLPLLTIIDKVPYLQVFTFVYSLWKEKDRSQSSKPGSWVSAVRVLVQHGNESGRCR